MGCVRDDLRNADAGQLGGAIRNVKLCTGNPDTHQCHHNRAGTGIIVSSSRPQSQTHNVYRDRIDRVPAFVTPPPIALPQRAPFRSPAWVVVLVEASCGCLISNA